MISGSVLGHTFRYISKALRTPACVACSVVCGAAPCGFLMSCLLH